MKLHLLYFLSWLAKYCHFERRKNGYVIYNYIIRAFVLKVARVMQRDRQFYKIASKISFPKSAILLLLLVIIDQLV